MADLVKDLTETVFDNYTTTLGESQDKVVVGNEKVVFAELSVDDKVVEYVEPTIRFTKWSEEESLTLSYPTPTGMTDKTLIDGEGLKLYGGAEDFYFNQYDDNTFKFGLILNEIPKNTQTWSFKLVGWENFDFFFQPPLKNVNEDGSTWEGGIQKKPLYYRPVEVNGSYAVYHKTKVNNQYKTGKFSHIFRPRLVDADNVFLGWVDLSINNGVYSLSISNIPQSIINSAKLPLRFNDTLGSTSAGASQSQDGASKFCQFTSGSAGTLTTGYLSVVSNGGFSANWKMALFTNSSNTPNTLVANSSGGFNWETDKGWGSFAVTGTISASTIYWIGFIADADGYFARWYYDTGSNLYGTTTGTYADFPPATAGSYTGGSAKIISAYYDYTPSAGGAVPIYTKEILSSLPATAANLSTEFTEQEYTNVLTDDGSYVELS